MYCTGPGGVVSRTKLTVSGALMFPATSTALTENVQVPSSSVLTSAESLAASSASTLPALRVTVFSPTRRLHAYRYSRIPEGSVTLFHCTAAPPARVKLPGDGSAAARVGVSTFVSGLFSTSALAPSASLSQNRYSELPSTAAWGNWELPWLSSLCPSQPLPRSASTTWGVPPALSAYRARTRPWNGTIRSKTPEEPVLTCSMGPAGSPDGSMRQ